MNNNLLKNGFTLVELLVVIVIIGILASISLTALSGTVNAAKESKTRGTISKLNAAIMEIYEGYQDKFDNITSYANISELPGNEIQQAKVKLHLIHDLMRIEMPDNINDVTTGVQPSFYTCNGIHYQLKNVPEVQQYYNNNISILNNTLTNNGAGVVSAELLYQIIVNLNPDAMENFHGSEIGDTNNNGLMEFLDAWGNPIRFIRFAPDFPYSDIQPKRGENKTNYQDPFNLEYQRDINGKIIMDSNGNPIINDNPSTWLLFPLIYSCGADSIDDISHNGYTITGDQSVAPFDALNKNGAATDAGGYDNIHNHRGSNSF